VPFHISSTGHVDFVVTPNGGRWAFFLGTYDPRGFRAAGPKHSYYFAISLEEWIALLEGADEKVLSKVLAGGFAGTYFGLYAFGEDP